jgi:hypothetical protein
MKKRTSTLIAAALLLTCAITGCANGEETGMPNPASVYCEEQGGTIELRDVEGGVAGYCVFDDDSECEEWAFFNGECAPGDSLEEVIGMPNPASVYCEEQGGTLEMRETAAGTAGYCLFDDGSECEEWAFFNGECQPGDSLVSEGLEVFALFGKVVSLAPGMQYDDYLQMAPDGSPGIGIEGMTPEIEAQIVALRDKEPPGQYAHFWGTLICPALDYGECQLRVSRLRVDGPGEFFDPDIVEDWAGTIHTGITEPGSGGDDYFQLAAPIPIQYGIVSALGLGGERPLEDQLIALRDSGTPIRIWGTLTAGIPDWNATQIEITRIELVGSN